MYRNTLLSLALVFFIGCKGDNSSNDPQNNSITNDDSKVVYEIYSSSAYSTHHNTKEDEIDKIVQELLPQFDVQFQEKIEETVSTYNHSISDDAKILLKNNMLVQLVNESKNQIRDEVGVELADVHNSLEAHSDLSDNQIYHFQIEESVQEYFKNEFTSTHVQPLMEKIADEIESSMLILEDASTQSRSISRRESSGESHQTLDNAQKTQDFNDYMTNLFGTYKAEGITTNGGGIDGGSLHGLARVTNSLSEDGMLTINEPSYKDGELEITTWEKDFKENFGDSNSKIKFTTSADINGDGEDVLVVALCVPNSTGDIADFYKIGNKDQFYDWEHIFKTNKINCHNITDMVAGDFDGDGKDEIAIGSSSDGVYIYDDATAGFAQMSSFNTGEDSSLSYRLAAGNVANKSYDDLAVLVQNNSESSSEAYLFEMSGMVYDSNNSIEHDYNLYTLNKQEFSDVAQGDVIISDLESSGRLKMYVLEMTTEEEKDKFTGDEWKENHKGFLAYDNHWCTYYGYYKNNFELWSADEHTINPTDDSATPQALNNVGSISVTNRISKSYNDGCKDSSEIDLTNSSDGKYGYLFSKNNKIEAVGYEQNSSNESEVSIIDLNGLPIKYNYFVETLNFEVSDQLYKASYYSANSKDAHKPNVDDNDYVYEDLYDSDYNYINSYIQTPNHDSYYHHNTHTANVSNKYGNRNNIAVTRSVETNEKGDGVVKNASTYPNDSMVLKYKRHQTLYTDPQVLMYLSAPPAMVGQNTIFEYKTQACDTVGTEDTKSNGFTSGLSVQLGAAVDIPLVSQDDILIGVSTEFNWSKDVSNYTSSSKCVEVSYESKSEKGDHVLIQSEIVDSYVYEVIKDLNNPDNVGEELTINVTRKKVTGTHSDYKILKTVDEYYAILDSNNREPYVDFKSLITHTAGDLGTYMDYTSYASSLRTKHNSKDKDLSYFNFYETDSYQVQADGENISKVEYSISSTTGSTISTSTSLEVSIVSEVEASGGAVVQAKSVADIKAGWTHSDTIAYNVESSNTKSYGFSAEGESTDADTSKIYNFGAFTYYISSLTDSKDENKGRPIQIIDFYIEN